MDDNEIVFLFEAIRALEQQLANAKARIEELEREIEKNKTT